MDGTFSGILLVTGFCATSGSSSYHLIGEAKTWNGSQEYCAATYTELLQFDGSFMNSTLPLTWTQAYTKAWIGLLAGTPVWTWLGEPPATYFNWSSDQPDNSSTGMCVFMTDVGDWYDHNCSELRKSVCSNGSSFTIETEMNWTDAMINCKEKNSTLVQIPDYTTNAEIRDLLSKGTEVWIGLNSTVPWFWSETRELVQFPNWKEGQPDNLSGNEQCGAMLLEDEKWTDEPCSTLYPFVCEETLTDDSSKQTVVKLTIQTTANLEDSEARADLEEKLATMLVKQGLNDFKLAWKNMPVKQYESGKKGTF